MAKNFTRDATGLVRDLGWWSSFGIGFGGVVLGVAMTSFYYAFPLTLPDADILVALLFLLIVLVPYLVVYSQLAIAIPRSGGDYIYVSRIFHPSLGLMQSWLAVFIVALNLPIFSDLVTSTYLPSFFTQLGYTGLANTLTEIPVRFVIDSVIIILSGILIIIPLRTYAKVQTVLVVLALVSPFVMLGVLTIGHSAFVSMWNAVSPISYSGVIQTATAAGYTTPKPALVPTILAAPLLGFYLLTIWPVQVGGELKNVKKSILVGLFGAVMFSWVVFTVGVPLYFNTLGFNFVNALNFIGPQSPVNPPYLNSIIGYVFHNVALSTAIDLSLVAAAFLVIPQSILVITRWMFAWSFDRVAPIRLADIHQKFGTPYVTVIIALIAGEVLLVAELYTSLTTILLNAALGSAIAFVPTLLAGMVLPWRRKQIFDSAPSYTKAKIGGLPIITICGAISGFGIIAYTAVLVTNPQLGFPVTPISEAFLLGWLLLGIALYFVARAYRKAKGIDISLAFREIPPE
ncbi:MAG: APC family permease [Nitrososphaerota archaeon]|nr:APC family permease [Nitrososphaerota archaeon]